MGREADLAGRPLTKIKCTNAWLWYWRASEIVETAAKRCSPVNQASPADLTGWAVLRGSSGSLWTVCAAALLAAISFFVAGRGGTAFAGDPYGVWMIENEVAFEISDCCGLLCGRIVYLRLPRDAAGELKREQENPRARAATTSRYAA